MKIRNGFVSNSSSSSFIIKKKGLTEEQKENIRLCGKLLQAMTYESICKEYDRHDTDNYGNRYKNIFVMEIDNNFSRSEAIDFFISVLRVPKENIICEEY